MFKYVQYTWRQNIDFPRLQKTKKWLEQNNPIDSKNTISSIAKNSLIDYKNHLNPPFVLLPVPLTGFACTLNTTVGANFTHFTIWKRLARAYLQGSRTDLIKEGVRWLSGYRNWPVVCRANEPLAIGSQACQDESMPWPTYRKWGLEYGDCCAHLWLILTTRLRADG